MLASHAFVDIGNDCLLRVVHPNAFGFRVWASEWEAGRLVSMHFDRPVSLAKAWGPVRRVKSDHPLQEHSEHRFMLRGAARGVHIRLNTSEPTWGFVLGAPYLGAWNVTCWLPVASTNQTVEKPRARIVLARHSHATTRTPSAASDPTAKASAQDITALFSLAPPKSVNASSVGVFVSSLAVARGICIHHHVPTHPANFTLPHRCV